MDIEHVVKMLGAKTGTSNGDGSVSVVCSNAVVVFREGAVEFHPIKPVEMEAHLEAKFNLVG